MTNKQSERERVIAELQAKLAGSWHEHNIVQLSVDAGRKAGLEEAAKVAEKLCTTTTHVEAAIRALGEKP